MQYFQFSLKMAGICHVRTTSEPPVPHPIVLKLEQDLHNLKASLTSSPAPNSQTMSNALRELGNLYNSIDEFLCLPTNQQALSHPHQKKWVEQQLDVSIKVLDLTDAARDSMVLMREHIQDLRSAIRKKGDNAYVGSQKKLHKETRTCFKLLKQVDGDKCGSCSSLVKDWDLMMVDRVLGDAKEIVIALFRSLMCLLSVPSLRMKACRWGFASKDGREVLGQLKGLESSIEGLENGSEFLFRRLIQNRVSLLNILSL